MNLYLGIAGIFALFGMIAFGANVMVALGIVGFFGLIGLVGFGAGLSVLSTVFFETTHSFHFTVIPLFLLMGFFALRAGLGSDVYEAAHSWLGGVRGGLAISTTVAAAGFGAASGSSVGTATVFTKIALPEMLDRGYDKGLASASIAIAGTLAVMIPPSAVMVIYGILTDSSIGKLLMAGILPGIVFGILLCLAIYITARRRPEMAPRSENKATWGQRIYSLRLAGPLALIVFSIIAGIYLGVFTPTEAGAMGALFTLILAIIRQRGIRGLELRQILLDTVRTSAMIFAVIICALVFSRFLALSGLTFEIGNALSTMDVNPWFVVFIVTMIYLVLGTMMDAPALLAISLPVTYPVMIKLGFDPIWFGVYVVLLVEIAAVTPPVGINCFVVQASSDGRIELEDVFKGLTPFLIAGAIMLLLLCFFPQLALYIPNSMR